MTPSRADSLLTTERLEPMATHFLTPCKVTARRWPDNSFNGKPHISDAHGVFVCEGMKTNSDVKVLTEVARRLNCHDELLKALKSLVAMNNCNYDRQTDDYQSGMTAAVAAIANATGDAANVPS